MHNRVKLFCWVGLVALAVSVAPAAELPEGFRLEPVVGGLNDPVDLADTPDGRVLIAERTTGDLRFMSKGLLQASPICSVSVDTTGDGGLLGVAVHPDFAENGWVYLYYTDLASAVCKVTRFTLGLDSCWGATDILADLGSGSSGLHAGGGIDFGPDGKLYVATGDMEIQDNGQDDQVLQGNVLRVNDDGSIPADNPDPASYVYAVGLRDPRGLTVNPAGQVYVSDQGFGPQFVHDELHLAGPNGNLGWADETGFGGIHDQPLTAWLPTIGIWGVTDYDGVLFPDAAADGLDSDHDSYGPDHAPGVLQADDNGLGECYGSVNVGQPCANNIVCLPARTGETSWCEYPDDAAEYCPGGSPLGDDDCDNLGAAGVDEPDESYLLDVFTAGETQIRRASLMGAQDQLSSWSTFMDSSFLPDCPTGWTGLMTGRDGHLYALATNGGGSGGALYRIVHDGAAGPREVSGPDSYVPLMIDRAGSFGVEISWEDIRRDAMQPQNNGALPTGLEREYTIWRGSIGSYYSHIAVMDGITGGPVNDAVRSQTLLVEPGRDFYFLVSGRSDNFEGTLGNGTAGARPGFAETDICDVVGDYKSPWNLFTCGRDFTLLDEYSRERNLHEFRGKAMMIDLSAEWCPPCNTEADALEGLHDEFKDRDVVVLSVLIDEETSSADWDGRPSVVDCRLWKIRSTSDPSLNHTFDCWADTTHCTPGANGQCASGSYQEAWPLYNSQGGYIPTNIILDQALGAAWGDSGYPESTIRARLNAIVGAVDTCLH